MYAAERRNLKWNLWVAGLPLKSPTCSAKERREALQFQAMIQRQLDAEPESEDIDPPFPYPKKD